MSRCSFDHHKLLVLNEQCFPRIYYFKTRLRRIYPRLTNILNFEFNHPNRGVKRLRKDDEELTSIGNAIGVESVVKRDEEKEIVVERNKEVEVGYIATDAKLLQEITESDIAKHPECIQLAKVNLQQRELSKRHLENDVIVIATSVKDLPQTLRSVEEATWIKHGIVAVFVDNTDTPQPYTDTLQAAKNKSLEVVIITAVDEKNTNDKTNISPTSFESFPMSKSPSPKRAAPRVRLATAASLTAPRSPVRSPSRRAMSPMQASPPDSPAKTLASSASSPSSSPSGSPVKTRCTSSALDQEALSKKSKLDFDEPKLPTTIYRRQESHESMETDETELCRQPSQKTEVQRNITEASSPESKFKEKAHWDTDELRKAVSFQLEVQVVRIIERIITLLKNVRARRDRRAEVAAVTTLDKLLFEVEGLLSQSVTENGTKMKKEIEKQRMSPKLTGDLLRVDGVYGCGTFYDRLNIHIEVNRGEDKEAIQKEIRKVAARYNYKDTDYEVNVVKSRPTMYGRLVICSV